MRFVLDFSMSMAWCFEDEASVYTDTVLQLLSNSEALVPSIWSLGIVNVLIVAERNKLISHAQIILHSIDPGKHTIF